jgi:hypothetical protein
MVTRKRIGIFGQNALAVKFDSVYPTPLFTAVFTANFNLITKVMK